MAFIGSGCSPAPDKLEKGFAHPPDSARPWVYWYFMDGNITREGITADLEAMRDAGIGGAIFLEVDLGLPRGPVRFMSPEWRQLFAHAVHEAERLGIEIVLGSGPGWCGTGGPWVKPEQSMQHLVASETNVVGPVKFDGMLPRPQPRTPFFGEATLTPELKKEWQEFYRDVVVLAFPKPQGDQRIAGADEKALYRRAPYSSQPKVRQFLATDAEFPAMPAAECIPQTGVVELTSRMSPDGHLTWDVPPGEGTILRFGRTATGQITRPAPAPGLGFETDKFDPAAIDAHFEKFVGTLLKEAGPRKNGPGGLSSLHFDSWEMGSQNWSEKFRGEFQRRRGYDPLRFLPAFTGRVVDNTETTERFLWDLRQTAQELVIENHLTRLKTLAHKNGLKFSVEPYDMNPTADLSLGAVADVPMCEFWWLGFDTFYSVIEAASIAHTGGRWIVGAESFTSAPGEDWKAYPANMKSLGDWAFAAGVNRIAFHRYQHQPAPDRWPGMQMGPYGVHWERTQTWWPMVSAYHEYLSRCQFLLREGESVADILFLAGEGAPHVFRAPPSATTGNPPDRRGYNFDGCAPEVLLAQARVRHGRIVFPGGTSYRLLVLPEMETMTPALLRKIKELVEAGATVVGAPPKKSPSLAGYPQCDAEVQNLVAELWKNPKGGVIWSGEFKKSIDPLTPAEIKQDVQPLYPHYDALARVLQSSGVPPDFETNGPIRYTHRTADGTEIYFVANRSEQTVDASCIFRVDGKPPELWHPVTGERRTLPVFTEKDGRTTIPLHFDPLESYFIVFCGKAGAPEKKAAQNFPALRAVQEITGPWEVSFGSKWSAPEKVTFATLEDWTKRSEDGIKYYSGMAAYRKTFDVPDSQLPGINHRIFLDLGVVKNMAHVRLNGRDLGVVWCAPWRVEVTDALKPGANELEITVANLWVNRLIGDAGLPPDSRRTWTSKNPYKADSPLQESGLLGPVTLQAAIESPIKP